ncbi:MAG: ATP-binding protein [Cyanothece sp. SIO2G6]|nr:ATP-binding protein [Cyanothece sp. SIO2G6]
MRLDNWSYVPFSSRNNAISGINTKLMVVEPGDTETILFTGHIGCGKTSELTQIARHQQDEFLVVNVDAELETDPNDLEFSDLYLLIIKRVEVELRQLGIAFDARILTSFENWFKEIINETDQTVARSVNVEAEASLGTAPFIAKLLVKLMAQIKASSTERQHGRQVIAPDVSMCMSLQPIGWS